MPQLVLLFWLNIFHPFYVSVTEIVHHKNTGTVQVSVRIFFDDFENIYIGGKLLTTGDFDPGPGFYPLSSAGSLDDSSPS